MQTLIEQELQNGFFSAIQISHLSPHHQDAFFTGYTTNEALNPIDQFTQFDLASLTKALFTAPAFYQLFENKELVPETKLSSFFPAFSDDITLLSLLNHSVGFPAWIPFYENKCSVAYSDKKQLVIDAIVACKPDYSTRYSDLTFLLLGFILEKIHRAPLSEIFADFKQDVSTVPKLQYTPAYAMRHEVVATSFSSIRNTICYGEVEDENCYWLEGVTGHAGLFGSATDVILWIFALMEKEWFSKWFEITNKAGFDTPEATNSSYGDNNPFDAAGHLGFTGTAFLFSPSELSATVVLTNRTHPDVNKKEWKKRIKKIRRQAFHHHHRHHHQTHTQPHH